MTIDEAIAICENQISFSSEEYRQVAQWLEELKRLREEKREFQIIARDNYEIGYNRAIDDFTKEICKMIVQSENDGNYRFYAIEIKQSVADLAEQLKESEEE